MCVVTVVMLASRSCICVTSCYGCLVTTYHGRLVQRQPSNYNPHQCCHQGSNSSHCLHFDQLVWEGSVVVLLYYVGRVVWCREKFLTGHPRPGRLWSVNLPAVYVGTVYSASFSEVLNGGADPLWGELLVAIYKFLGSCVLETSKVYIGRNIGFFGCLEDEGLALKTGTSLSGLVYIPTY